jgi:Holliday junction resolvase RusA-like endonuclease
MKYTFTIPGKPTGKGRARVVKNRYTGQPMSYTPSETVNYENLIKEIYVYQSKGKKLDGAIQQIVTAYYPIPKGTSKKKRELMLTGKIRPVVRPDYDNVEKVFSDALESIAFDNDSQIVSASFEKYYGENPRTVVVLRELTGGKMKSVNQIMKTNCHNYKPECENKDCTACEDWWYEESEHGRFAEKGR